jgi:hypothetical protein
MTTVYLRVVYGEKNDRLPSQYTEAIYGLRNRLPGLQSQQFPNVRHHHQRPKFDRNVAHHRPQYPPPIICLVFLWFLQLYNHCKLIC